MGNKLKNFTKEGQKLPLFGIGPYLIYGTVLLNALVIFLASYIFKTGILGGSFRWIFRVMVQFSSQLDAPYGFSEQCVPEWMSVSRRTSSRPMVSTL